MKKDECQSTYKRKTINAYQTAVGLYSFVAAHFILKRAFGARMPQFELVVSLDTFIFAALWRGSSVG
ncbi:MAG: hypothetical protein ABIX01_20265 [Chitinophagaceae bacterium]